MTAAWLIVLAGCANVATQPSPAAPPVQTALTGTATFAERTLLPANAVFEVILEETSGTNMPTTVINADRRPAAGVSTVDFSIPFLESQLRAGQRYAVRARVLVNGQIIFVTDPAVPVLASPQDKTVQLVLKRPAPPPRQTATRPGASPAAAAGATRARPKTAAERAAETRAEQRATAQRAAEVRAQQQAEKKAAAERAAQARAQQLAEQQAERKAAAERAAQAKAEQQAEKQAAAERAAQLKAEQQAQQRAEQEAAADRAAQVRAEQRAEQEAEALRRKNEERQARLEAASRAAASSVPTPAPTAPPAVAQTPVPSPVAPEPPQPLPPPAVTAPQQAAPAPPPPAAVSPPPAVVAPAPSTPAPETPAPMVAVPSPVPAPAPAPVVPPPAEAPMAVAPAPTPPVPAATPAPVTPPAAPPPLVAAVPTPPPPTAAPAPQEPPRVLDRTSAWRGLYRYAPDASTFEDCDSGARLPVSQEGANFVLELAYLRFYPASGAGPGVLATLNGRVLPRPAPNSGAPRNTLVIDSFISLGGDSCPAPASAAPAQATAVSAAANLPVTLENTRWKLEQLGGQPVEAIEKQREPHIVLQSASKRVSGSGSCNQLLLAYTLEGNNLRFAEGGSTKRTCTTGMEQENAFLATLPSVTNFGLEARSLRLMDANGRVLAQFRAEEL